MKELSKQISLLKEPSGVAKNSEQVFEWLYHVKALCEGQKEIKHWAVFYQAMRKCIKHLSRLDGEDNTESEITRDFHIRVSPLEDKAVIAQSYKEFEEELFLANKKREESIASIMAQGKVTYDLMMMQKDKRNEKVKRDYNNYDVVVKDIDIKLLHLYAIKRLASCLRLELSCFPSWVKMSERFDFEKKSKKESYLEDILDIIREMKTRRKIYSEAINEFFNAVRTIIYSRSKKSMFMLPTRAEKCQQIDNVLEKFVENVSEVIPELFDDETDEVEVINPSIPWKVIVAQFDTLQDMILCYRNCNENIRREIIDTFLKAQNLDNDDMLMVVYAVLKTSSSPELSMLKNAIVMDESQTFSPEFAEQIRKSYKTAVYGYMNQHREDEELGLPQVLRDLKRWKMKGFFRDLCDFDLREADLGYLQLKKDKNPVKLNRARLGDAYFPLMWEVSAMDVKKRRKILGIFAVAKMYELPEFRLDPNLPIAEEDLGHYTYLHLIACKQYIDPFFRGTLEDVNQAIVALSQAASPLGGARKYGHVDKEFQARFYLYLAKRFFESPDDAFIEAGRDWFLSACRVIIREKNEGRQKNFYEKAAQIIYCAIVREANPKDLLTSLQKINFAELSATFVTEMCYLLRGLTPHLKDVNLKQHAYFRVVFEMHEHINNSQRKLLDFLDEIPRFIRIKIPEDAKEICQRSFKQRVLKVLRENPECIFGHGRKLNYLFGEDAAQSWSDPLSGEYKALKESVRKTQELRSGWQKVASPPK